MEPNTMITVGLVPSQQLVSLLTDEEGNWRDVPEGQTVVPLVKVPKPEGAWEPSIVWFEDRVERQWVAGTPPTPISPIVQGEQWVESQGYSAARLVTCFDLLLQVKEADPTLATRPILAATYTWLQTVKGMAVAGLTTFPPAPHTFEEVVTETAVEP
jgi:hypothetical protein